MRDKNARCEIKKCDMRDKKCEMRDKNATCEIKNATCEMKNATCEIKNATCEIKNATCEIEYCEIPGRVPSSRNLTHDNMAGSGDNDEEVMYGILFRFVISFLKLAEIDERTNQKNKRGMNLMNSR